MCVILSRIEIKKQDLVDSDKQLKELENDEAKLEEELKRCSQNLKKLSKKGIDVLSLLQTDYEKCQEDLSRCRKKNEEVKMQILQNDGLKVSSENNVEKYKDQLEAVKNKIQGKYYKLCCI